jgi:hypothetical protein
MLEGTLSSHSHTLSIKVIEYRKGWSSPEAEFLEEIQTEVLRVFLLAIHRHLY